MIDQSQINKFLDRPLRYWLELDYMAKKLTVNDLVARVAEVVEENERLKEQLDYYEQHLTAIFNKGEFYERERALNNERDGRYGLGCD